MNLARLEELVQQGVSTWRTKPVEYRLDCPVGDCQWKQLVPTFTDRSDAEDMMRAHLVLDHPQTIAEEKHMDTPVIYLELPHRSRDDGTFHLRLDSIDTLEDRAAPGDRGTVIGLRSGRSMSTSMNRTDLLQLMEREANR